MITPDCNTYLNQEVDPVISRYEELERKKRYEFYGWQMALVIAGAAITIFNSLPFKDDLFIQVLISVLGGAVAVIGGLIPLLRSRKLWGLFGVWIVKFKSEKTLYEYAAGAYSIPNDQQRCTLFKQKFQELREKAAEQTFNEAIKE